VAIENAVLIAHLATFVNWVHQAEQARLDLKETK
jgi:hypothetical protein